MGFTGIVSIINEAEAQLRTVQYILPLIKEYLDMYGAEK